MPKILLDVELQINHLLLARKPDLVIINKKKRTCYIGNFAIPVDHLVKIKESEKRDKNFGLAREVRKLWNMRLTVIPIVTGMLGRSPKAWKGSKKS